MIITPVAAVIRAELKTPYNDGTTHVIFEPLDFLSRLAALVPKPRVNPGSSPGQVLTRYHGVFTPLRKALKDSYWPILLKNSVFV
jgi:hypothetical protein